MAARIVNTHEAKSRLSELIREAELGHDVIVAPRISASARVRRRGFFSAVTPAHSEVDSFDATS